MGKCVSDGEMCLSNLSFKLSTNLEGMYSFSWSFRQLGRDTRAFQLLDRVERLAFNALPGTVTADMWQHQYDHMTNALASGPGVLCGGSNGGEATTYGLQPNFPCCTVNLPQGWPKLATSAVLIQGDAEEPRSLFVAHFLPINVSVPAVGSLSIDTEYPFGDTVTLTATNFNPGSSLRIGVRIPYWATTATVSANITTADCVDDAASTIAICIPCLVVLMA